MEEKRENPELKPYIENFAIEMLEGCELFVNTYGKGFVKERLSVNLRKVFTEELNSRVAGQYTLGTSGIITLFAKGSNGKLLTFEDIEENPRLEATTLHEAVHAVFNKTPEECEALGLQFGSGIHSVYKNSYMEELGRGLNEGFTNWVCEKAGLNPESYLKFTNMIKIVEMAIGPEKVMEFGRGDIEKNIAPLLDMTPEDCAVFLAKADSIYEYDDLSKDYFDVKQMLSSKLKLEKEREKNPDATMSDFILEDVEKLKSNKLYRGISKNSDYLTYAKDNNLDPELDETKKEYFSHIHELYSTKSKVLLHEIQGELLTKYFMKEFEEITSANTCSVEQYQKFSNLSGLLLTYGERTNDVLKAFDEKFEILRGNFFNTVSNDIKKSIQEGTLSVEQLSLYKNIFANGDYRDSGDFYEIVSKLMLPENPDMYRNFFGKLSLQNMVSDVFNYKLLELETENGTRAELFFDTQKSNHFSRYIQVPKIVGVSDEIENPNNIIDITLGNLQSIQEIVKSFLSLKEEIKQKSPNAKMQIVDNIIVTTGVGEEPSYYMIEGNDIVLAQAKELLPQNRQPTIGESEKKDSHLQLETINIEEPPINAISTQLEDTDHSNYLKPISKNPFKRFLLELRRRLFRREPAITVASEHQDEHPNETSQTMKDSAKAFNDRIHVDVSNQNISMQTTNNKTKQKDKDEDLSK